jgi:hypothetical protein
MASPKRTSHGAAPISITATYGHDPERAVLCLVQLLARAGRNEPCASEGQPPWPSRLPSVLAAPRGAPKASGETANRRDSSEKATRAP